MSVIKVQQSMPEPSMPTVSKPPPAPDVPAPKTSVGVIESSFSGPSDDDLVQLLWERSDEGLRAFEARYGRWLYAICQNILSCPQDSEECVNDTLLNVWNAIPPEKPQNLRAYAGRVARNIALSRRQKNHAAKRSSGPMALLSELDECLPDLSEAVDNDLRCQELIAHINAYLHTLDDESRILFARRYWYVDPLADIAADLSISPRTASLKLFRMRKGLRKYLTEKGVYI